MSEKATSLLNLFGQVETVMQTSSASKMVKSPSSLNVRKQPIQLNHSKSSGVNRSRNTVVNFSCCKMESETHTPCGPLEGALPYKLIIKGIHWRYISTKIVNGEAFTMIKNTVTGQVKTLKNETILKYI